MTGTIARNDSDGVQVQLVNGYSVLLAYDWENDNTTGTLPVKPLDNDSSTIMCPNINKGTTVRSLCIVRIIIDAYYNR